MPHWFVAAGLQLVRLMSHLPVPILRAIGWVIGHVLYLLATQRRTTTLINLRLCFPDKTEKERRRIARASFISAGKGVAELALSWFATPAKLRQISSVHGIEHLNNARSDGCGVILLAFHFNDLELGGTTLATHINNMAAMYRPHDHPVFENAMRAGRARVLNLIERDDVRATVRALKNGAALWYAADQDYGAAHSIMLPFFGIPAATITATTRFVRLSGARVIPMTQRRTTKGLDIELHPALPIPLMTPEQDALCINQFLEKQLRHSPNDYMWMHKRFKTRPEGERSFYEKPADEVVKLSDRRLATFFREKHDLPTFCSAASCAQLFPNLLLVFFSRTSHFWWKRTAAQHYIKRLYSLKEAGVPVATLVRHQFNKRQSMDVVHIQIPPGVHFLSAALSDSEKHERVSLFIAAHSQKKLNASFQHYWLSEQGELIYLGD